MHRLLGIPGLPVFLVFAAREPCERERCQTHMIWRQLAAMLVFSLTAFGAGEDVQKTIRDLYNATFASMKEAKTKEDLGRMVNAIDAPEWVGNSPEGETLTRVQSQASLEPILAIPSDKRPVPKLDFVYIKETGWNVLAVYWVYRQTENQLVGSMARDTWVRTAQGWRRIKHE